MPRYRSVLHSARARPEHGAVCTGARYPLYANIFWSLSDDVATWLSTLAVVIATMQAPVDNRSYTV